MKENCGKIEHILNLALDATREEREKSLNLDVGYDVADDSWEVIVKFFGTTEELRQKLSERFPEEQAQIGIYNLTNEYAILRIPQPLVELVASMPEIEYMEKPKRLFFSVENGKRSSCINPLQTGQGTSPTSNLTGKEVLVAVIDSGIDYAHPDFCNSDGTTRIAVLWDQTLDTVYERETINLALRQESEQERYAICPSRDASGHGTHVAGIAAGNGRASAGRYTGVAPKSELLVVKLGYPGENAFPRTTELMTALDYVIQKAIEYRKPAAVNISIGNTYGGHSGRSLLETYIDDISNYGRNVICVGSGNEGAARGHAQGTLREGFSEEIQLAVAPYEATLSVQIWKNYADDFDISIIAPSGKKAGPLQQILGAQRFTLDGTEILLYYGEPSPYSPYQEIYISFLPIGDYVDSGVWRFELIPHRIVQGNYNLWLPSQAVLSAGTGFLFPSEEITLTIPSTASRVITVGAYDAYSMQLADFSGRGYTRETNQIKPDLAAPGVNIISCAPGGGYVAASGTSMATPFVTGGAALLMQWGITDGNDPFLYGEKVKAYFIKGARRIEAVAEYPNPEIGWGTLCVAESLPG